MKKLCIYLSSLALMGCVFHPKVYSEYDDKCGVEYKKFELELDPEEIDFFECGDQKCKHAFMLSLVEISIEALVAGSIVIVGNSVSWLEKEARCTNLGEKRNDGSTKPKTLEPPTIYTEEIL